VGAVLIDRWLGDAPRILIVDDASVSEVREAIRTSCKTLGIAPAIAERMAAAASELARNQLAHASHGVIAVRAVERASTAGIEVIAADRGRGIADPTEALRGAPRSEGSLGVGLSAAARQADELDLDTRIGQGTCVRIRAFARAIAKSEVGIYATPHPDETVIGDHASVLRDREGLVVAVADGLGHGPEAREAALIAVDEVRGGRGLDEILAAAHTSCIGSRGAVMSIIRNADTLEHAGVGNIGTRVIGIDGAGRPLVTMAGTLGSAMPRRLHIERTSLAAGEVLVMFSDGLQSRLDLRAEPALIRHHPIVIAHHLATRFTRGTDDALVVVVR
jgi:anti-sigma regulatory factor (Ser/Thr protein kinase)